MSRSRITSGVDFVATFFVNGQMKSQLLSDVLKNRNDPLLPETLELPTDFVLPFVREERDGGIVYSLKHRANTIYEAMLHEYPCEDHIIHSGDYFTFRNRRNGQTINILLIATSDIVPGYSKYKLPNNANVFIGHSSSNDIKYSFSDYVSQDSHAVNKLCIYIGSHYNESVYKQNCRPKAITLTFSDGSTEFIRLEDSYDEQIITFKQFYYTDSIKLTIEEVYTGTTYLDTVIAELDFVAYEP